ncbi:response regulator [Pseudomonas sp. MT4]|nr:response regulator [Pseudomonas sp. MT4]
MIPVLMVDDEQLIIEILDQVLKDVGFRVTQASNGKESMSSIAS